MPFIHADMINGNTLATEDNLPDVEVSECQDMDDVRYYLSRMSVTDLGDHPFERLLWVPEDLVTLIDNEYGVQA